MANYSIKQIAYNGQDSCLSAYPVDESGQGNATVYQASGWLKPINVPGSEDATGDFGTFGRAPYQQILLNKYYWSENDGSPIENSQPFDSELVYYLKLTLPRNNNYDLNFALLAIPEFGEYDDLDQKEYQFLKYIHVPKSTTSGLGQSTVILYEEPKLIDGSGKVTTKPKDAVRYEYRDTDVKVAIAYPMIDENGNMISVGANDVGKIFYKYSWQGNVESSGQGNESNSNMGLLEYYFVEKVSNENRWTFVKAGKYYGKNYGTERADFAPLGKTTSIMVHSWINKDTDDTCTYEVIFKPRIHRDTNPLRYLYLYLIPESWDNDISWLEEQNNSYSQYYGRHVDLDNIKCELYAVKNLLGDMKPKRIGIWGRSELLFTINGEEIRIGPSGYYELQDFDVNYLGVVAKGHEDQFTIDIQY